MIKKKTSLFRFGIDHDFWQPHNLQKNIDVFSLGSDVHRDYEIFNKINLDLRFIFLTKRGKNLVQKKNYSVLGGSKNEPLISDETIRDYYNKSKIVVVSLHDTLSTIRIQCYSASNGMWKACYFNKNKRSLG